MRSSERLHAVRTPVAPRPRALLHAVYPHQGTVNDGIAVREGLFAVAATREHFSLLSRTPYARCHYHAPGHTMGARQAYDGGKGHTMVGSGTGILW